MTATTLDQLLSLRKDAACDRLADAATRLYNAECGLHIARQTGVDSWVAAAYDRLHIAICEHRAASAAAAGVSSQRAARLPERRAS